MLILISLFGYLNIENVKLKNNLNLYMIKNRLSPIVTVVLSFKAGGEYQTPEDAGLFHLVEHMFFKGNKKYKTQEEFMKKVRELGIFYNGATSHNYVVYFYTLPKEKLKEGLEFAYHAITGILFDEKELEKEKTVVLDEYNRDYSDPLMNFHVDLSKLFFEEEFYRDDLLGPKHNILKAEREIMIKQYEKFYGPENCNLIISGDIDFKETLKLAKKIFERWKKKTSYQKPLKLPELKTKKFLRVKSKDIKSSRITLLFRGPSTLYERKDTYIADLVGKMFSLPYSPFQIEFVNSGIAGSATFSYYTKKASGEIYLNLDLEKSKIEEALEKINYFLNSIDDEKWFPPEIIEDAKTSIENDFYLQTENSQRFALEFSFWITSADFEYFKNYVDEIKKLNKEDIKEFLKNYIKNKNYVMGILEPEED
ncbi:MAG: pitrilysin family protein [Candidatus Hydrothermales bacterium]